MGKDLVHQPELDHIADKIGTFIEYWGFKRIHGLVWTHIFLSATPIDASTIVKRLGVSKALVSLAIKDLMFYKVIEVVGPGNRRKILLKSNSDLIQVIINVLRLRERKLLSEIMSSHKNLLKMSESDQSQLSICAEKIKELGEMIETAELTLDGVIASNLLLHPDRD